MRTAIRSKLVQARSAKFRGMVRAPSFDELSRRIADALRDSPPQDLAKNLRVLLSAWLDRSGLVLREDFDIQKELLERAQAKLHKLEARIADLEARARGKRAP